MLIGWQNLSSERTRYSLDEAKKRVHNMYPNARTEMIDRIVSFTNRHVLVAVVWPVNKQSWWCVILPRIAYEIGIRCECCAMGNGRYRVVPAALAKSLVETPEVQTAREVMPPGYRRFRTSKGFFVECTTSAGIQYFGPYSTGRAVITDMPQVIQLVKRFEEAGKSAA